MAWLQAASFGISALGHVLNRTGGRKNVKATMADTSFIDSEVETIRNRNEAMTDKMLQTANAGTGFAELTSNRVNNAMGVGQANSMLDNARIEGRESAFNAGMQNEQASQSQVNQLTGIRAQLEQYNASVLNNEAVTNFMANRSDTQNIFGALQAGVLSYANQRRDDKRFDQSVAVQNNQAKATQSMWEAYMNNVN